ITRAAAQASAFARLLSAAGADVLEAPTIAIGPPDSWGPLDAALERLSTFQWVVFTSVNGVAMVGARLADRGLGWTALTGVRAALERGEVHVVTFTSSSTAQSFAALFTDEERARLLAGVTIASIGPITAATAASVGLATRVMPDEYTIPALARAIVAHFASRAERRG